MEIDGTEAAQKIHTERTITIDFISFYTKPEVIKQPKESPLIEGTLESESKLGEGSRTEIRFGL